MHELSSDLTIEPVSMGLITIAVGKKYIKMAKYLAYSGILHSPSILRAVITDDCDTLKGLYDFVIQYKPELGDPFETKTRLHLYTPFSQTLFADADSMIFTDLTFLWKFLDDNTNFAYYGTIKTEGKWYGDIKKICEISHIPWLPKWNSGMFLFKNNTSGIQIFEHAYSSFQTLRELNLAVLRGKMMGDEPCFSIALAKFNQRPVKDDYSRMSRSLILTKKVKIDIIKGIAQFLKNDHLNFPSIVHFCGQDHREIYVREKIKLFLFLHTPFDYFFIFLISEITATFFRIKFFIKRCFKYFMKNINRTLL
jgi:hypothetical protein